MHQDTIDRLTGRSRYGFAPGVDKMTDEQRCKLFGLMGQITLATRSQRLLFATAALRRPVTSFKTLTQAEASTLISHLETTLLLVA